MTKNQMQLYESLKAIFLHIDNHEKAFLSQYGLNIPRFYVLIHLKRNPGINYIDLSDLLLCTKSNTTRVVQGMLRDGLIDRANHPMDGRSFQLFLTENGQVLLDQVYPNYVKLVNQLMSQFSDEEMTRYIRDSQHIETTLAPTKSTSKLNTQVMRVRNAQL